MESTQGISRSSLFTRCNSRIPTVLPTQKLLPEILSKSYDDKPDAKTTPITFWGVNIDPAAPEKDARVSVILMKFLRARYTHLLSSCPAIFRTLSFLKRRNINVGEAQDMLVNTLRWREQFGVQAACAEVFPKEVFENLGHIYGKDKGGRPVV